MVLGSCKVCPSLGLLPGCAGSYLNATNALFRLLAATAQSAIVGTLDIAFAYGGQINWMRYITTMKKRTKFAGAVSITTALMTLVYLCVSVTGYTAFGNAIDVHK